jgi:metal-responsive CopG/Arc/MetJ family transcriptional regulator
MRAVISIPDEVFERAERHAGQLGITRSEFFSRAAQRYSAELEAESMTARIDAALAAAGDDDSNDVVARHGRQSVQDTDDDW